MGMCVALRCLGATYLDNFGRAREPRVCVAVRMCVGVLQPVNLQDKNPCLVVGRLPRDRVQEITGLKGSTFMNLINSHIHVPKQRWCTEQL